MSRGDYIIGSDSDEEDSHSPMDWSVDSISSIEDLLTSYDGEEDEEVVDLLNSDSEEDPVNLVSSEEEDTETEESDPLRWSESLSDEFSNDAIPPYLRAPERDVRERFGDHSHEVQVYMTACRGVNPANVGTISLYEVGMPRDPSVPPAQFRISRCQYGGLESARYRIRLRYHAVRCIFRIFYVSNGFNTWMDIRRRLVEMEIIRTYGPCQLCVDLLEPYTVDDLKEEMQRIYNERFTVLGEEN